MENDPETCIGCGAQAERLPWVAVLLSAGEWASRPVCDACHRDPAHRSMAPIKGHFFQRHQAAAAVAAAGSAALG